MFHPSRADNFGFVYIPVMNFSLLMYRSLGQLLPKELLEMLCGMLDSLLFLSLHRKGPHAGEEVGSVEGLESFGLTSTMLRFSGYL